MVISERVYLFLLTILALQRVFELLLSRRNADRALRRGGVETGHAHFRVMAAFHTMFIASCASESIFAVRTISPIVSSIALAAAAVAQVLRYGAVHALGDQWNVRIIVMPGAPLVTGGLYRWIRHPNYVAVVLEMVAVPMIRGSWMTAVLFSIGNALILAVRIPAEERALGQNYAQTFADVARFIPRVRSG